MSSLHDRYTKIILEEAISKGSFAEVYKARIFDRNDQAYRIAVKILKRKWIEKKDLINRLQDEADLLAKLNHPNIISALGFTEIYQDFQSLQRFPMIFKGLPRSPMISKGFQ